MKLIKDIILSEAREKFAQIKHNLQVSPTVQNNFKEIYQWMFMYEDILARSDSLKLQTRIFSFHKTLITGLTGVM